MTAVSTPVLVASSSSAKLVLSTVSNGLTSDEAGRRLEKDGPNAMPDTSAHAFRNALAKFWAPVPWLLEASIVLQVVLHKYFEAAVIAGLLIFNAALAFFQEGRAQATLLALKSRLALNASVRRDGVWKTIPATELVCDDLVKLSLGGVVAADVHLVDGSVLLDQSMLTGESLPIEAGSGMNTYAGALVRRGEATAEVTATGVRTKLGVPQNWFAPRTLSAHSRRPCCGLSVILRSSMASSSFSSGHMPIPIECRGARLFRFADVGPGGDSCGIACDLHPCDGARSPCFGKGGRLPTRLSAVDEAATIDILVFGQDRNSDTQRTFGHERPADAWFR